MYCIPQSAVKGQILSSAMLLGFSQEDNAPRTV